MGYTDERLLFKSLKKNKGDLANALDFLARKDSIEKVISRDFKDTPLEGERIKRGGKYRKERIECSSSGEDSDEIKKVRKMQRMLEKLPQFEAFNKKMIDAGFLDTKKNFNALKKKEGNEEKAMEHLRMKSLIEKIELQTSLAKGEYSRVVVDCNNCFYIETSFMKKAIKGNYKEIEEKIATLLRLFQNYYGSSIEVVLAFDNSKLMKDDE